MIKIASISIIFIIIFLFILILLCFFGNKIKKINNDIKTKKIYIIWKDDNGEGHGFGDKIRGAIAVHQYCNKYNIKCIFDAHQHQIGNFLKNSKCKDYKLVEESKPYIVVNNHFHFTKQYDELEKFLLSKKDEENIFISTNTCCNENISNDDIKFAKYIIEPIDSLKKEVDKKIKELPKDYTIQHFRFNDNHFGNDTDNNKFEECYNLLKGSYKPTDVLISTSTNFKKYVKSKMDIKTINDEPIAHLAYNKNNEELKRTFIEFYILCKSKKIHTYNEYDWVSNFVLWSSKIYKIPLIHKKI